MAKHIVLLCATKRGYRCVERLLRQWGEHRYTIFSFREMPWEPPYLDDLEALARRESLDFYEARDVSHSKFRGFWRDNPVDLILLVNWRYITPMSVLNAARLGAFVMHDSLLPKYRGFSPTVWSMINGETETGVTLFQAVAELDAGGIVDQRAVGIGCDETIADVVENVTLCYLDMLERNLPELLEGKAALRPQDHRQATYTVKWTPQDARIDWRCSAREIHDLARATTRPYPGAFTFLGDRKLTIWSTELPRDARRYVSRAPGRVVERRPGIGSVVLTGDGPILLKEAQLEGEAPVTADAILKSVSQTVGE